MVTKSTEFNYKECEKIDGRMVNAYIDAHLDEENPVNLVIESTWGDSVVDLTEVVKATETITHMELGSNAIEYFAEDGHVDCIYGDDLSRIISMHLLKDVDITTPPTDGDIYMYDENKGKFVTFNLKEYMDNIEQILNNYAGQINRIKNIVARPAGIPEDTVLCWGNINNYGDHTNNNLKTSGLYTHAINFDKENDQYFA